jgi:hypothetical protein
MHSAFAAAATAEGGQWTGQEYGYQQLVPAAAAGTKPEPLTPRGAAQATPPPATAQASLLQHMDHLWHVRGPKHAGNCCMCAHNRRNKQHPAARAVPLGQRCMTSRATLLPALPRHALRAGGRRCPGGRGGS